MTPAELGEGDYVAVIYDEYGESILTLSGETLEFLTEELDEIIHTTGHSYVILQTMWHRNHIEVH